MNLRLARVTVCGEPLALSLFGSEGSASVHLRKHVLDPTERWETIAPPADLDLARRGDRAALDRLYDAYADEIAAGLRFAARHPCHLHDVAPLDTEPGRPPAWGFLSLKGVRIFADRRKVRTAYRPALRGSGNADYVSFARGWFDFLVKSAGRACVGADEAGTPLPPPNVVAWRALCARREAAP